MDFKIKHKGDGKSDSSKSASSKEKEAEDDYIYAPVTQQAGQQQQLHQHRTLFVVDLSRLKAERDTLENAMVMYRPEKEFKKVLSCDQIVSIVSHKGITIFFIVTLVILPYCEQ